MHFLKTYFNCLNIFSGKIKSTSKSELKVEWTALFVKYIFFAKEISILFKFYYSWSSIRMPSNMVNLAIPGFFFRVTIE